jgi:DNA-binding NarL/FixJ family response regulator
MMEASRHEEEVRAARTKVLVATGHRLFRRGLKEILSSVDEDIEVLGEAQDDDEAVKFASEMEPDVVVLDAEGPSAEDCKAVERLLECSPASGVVVIALQDGSAGSIRQLLSEGVSAYLDADASPEDLVAAVRTAAHRGSRGAGNAFLSTPEAVLVEQEETAKYRLSRRELEVLTLAARGLSNRQIANTLPLAEATVKRHLANLYRKLGVVSRGEATRQALTEGWLDVRDLGQDARDRGRSEEVDEPHWGGSQVLLRPAG